MMLLFALLGACSLCFAQLLVDQNHPPGVKVIFANDKSHKKRPQPKLHEVARHLRKRISDQLSQISDPGDGRHIKWHIQKITMHERPICREIRNVHKRHRCLSVINDKGRRGAKRANKMGAHEWLEEHREDLRKKKNHENRTAEAKPILANLTLALQAIFGPGLHPWALATDQVWPAVKNVTELRDEYTTICYKEMFNGHSKECKGAVDTLTRGLIGILHRRAERQHLPRPDNLFKQLDSDGENNEGNDDDDDDDDELSSSSSSDHESERHRTHRRHHRHHEDDDDGGEHEFFATGPLSKQKQPPNFPIDSRFSVTDDTSSVSRFSEGVVVEE